MAKTTTKTATRSYALDRSHSEIAFQVRHLLSKVRGRFSDFDATLDYDEENPELSSVELTVKAATIDTNEPQRDAHLRSADFFDTDKYPVLTFVSRRIERRSEQLFDVHGDLTMHGVTKSIVLPVSLLGVAKDPWGHEKLAFETEATLNRKDFGLNWNAALETGGFLVGDEVKVSLSLQLKENQG